MVAPPVTEDYYLILEVEQNATPQSIVTSYRRLALKLHPDRNAKHDATEAFQRLGRAYETLNDEIKRRDYDRIYPSIRKRGKTPHPTSTTSSSSTSTPQAGVPSEAVQIAAIQKTKQERSVRWQARRNVFDTKISDLQRRIQQLQRAIKNMDSILVAEAAEEAWKKSWTAWFLSPVSTKAKESEEEKERKSRERQERRIEKDMKERRLQFLDVEVKVQEGLLQQAREEVDAANLCDDRKIREIEARVRAREARERQEREREQRERWMREARERQERERRERQEREKRAREWNERENQRLERERQQREEAERAAQESLRAFLREQHNQRQQQQQQANNAQRKNRAREAHNHHYTYPHASTCQHHGWWPKVQGRANCPNCNESWTYLLKCPGCDMKRCPKCQAAIRRVRQNGRAHSPRRHRRRRSPSPEPFDYD